MDYRARWLPVPTAPPRNRRFLCPIQPSYLKAQARELAMIYSGGRCVAHGRGQVLLPPVRRRRLARLHHLHRALPHLRGDRGALEPLVLVRWTSQVTLPRARLVAGSAAQENSDLTSTTLTASRVSIARRRDRVYGPDLATHELLVSSSRGHKRWSLVRLLAAARCRRCRPVGCRCRPSSQIYWMHRTLHTNKFLYKYVHALHHKYNSPETLSPWASIAFNPLDGILQVTAS